MTNRSTERFRRLLFLCFMVCAWLTLSEAAIAAPGERGMAIYENSQFGFSLRYPKDWKADESKEADGVGLELENESETGSLSVMAMNLPENLPQKRFIQEMEQELSKEISFITAAKRKKIIPPTELRGAATELTFRRYQGRYWGYRLEALVGFRVIDRKGYVLLAVYESDNAQTRQRLHQALGGFEFI